MYLSLSSLSLLLLLPLCRRIDLGHHGLSGCRSAGRIARNACINDIIRRALAILEPNDLVHDDGEKTDGIYVVAALEDR